MGPMRMPLGMRPPMMAGPPPQMAQPTIGGPQDDNN